MKNIYALQHAAHAFSAGNLGERVKIETSDEIKQIGDSFNEVADAFQSINEKLALANNELNVKVQELDFRQYAIDEHAIISITDRRGDIIYANDKFCEISGYSREELLGKNHRLLKSGIHGEELYKDLWATIASGRDWHGELCNRNKSGLMYWVRSTIVPFLDDKGKPERYLSIRTDITNAKENEERFNKISSRIPGMVYQFRLNADGSSCFPFCSEAIKDIYRVSAKDVKGDAASVFTKVHPEDVDRVAVTLTQSAQTLRSWNIEYRVKFDDGSVRWLQTNAVPSQEADDTVLWHGFTSDITERKKLERVKSEFVSTVSHELRTPLTAIHGALRLVLGKSSEMLSDKVKQILTVAERNSARLTLLINDILDLEKIDANRLELDFKSIDLIELAKRALEDNEAYAQAHQVHLSFETTLAKAPIDGDANRLLQVFANLISNAVKYSLQGGAVEISIARIDDNFRVAVRDHGAGIPEEFHSQIFKRFAQADSSDSREKSGTGLGLSITKAIIGHHAGSIGFESQVNKGTEFYFIIPEK